MRDGRVGYEACRVPRVSLFCVGYPCKDPMDRSLRGWVGIMYADLYNMKSCKSGDETVYPGADTGELVIVTLLVAELTRRHFVADMEPLDLLVLVVVEAYFLPNIDEGYERSR